MTATILPALLLAAAALPAADTAAVDATIADVYRPYSQEMTDTASWEYPVYSAEIVQLVDDWQRVVPNDEPDDLNDGDWLCLCQDWDSKGFKVTPGVHKALSPDTAEVTVKINLGFDEPREARLVLKKEGAAWKVDDLFADDGFPHGLKQALRDTIAADKALKAAKH